MHLFATSNIPAVSRLPCVRQQIVVVIEVALAGIGLMFA